MTFLALLLLFAAPFWQTKRPADWTEEELAQMFTNSPWAQALTAQSSADAPPVSAYLATAGPMQQAERERDRRRRKKVSDPMAEEYRAWLEENRATQIVLAVAMNGAGLSDAREARRMEEECVMRVGRKKLKMTGHFPPSPGDPYLRLAFPRQVTASDKTVTFELYLPGIALPFRIAEFKVKDLTVNGSLEL